MILNLTHNEIQESVLCNNLKEGLLEVFNNNFFTKLKTNNISLDGYKILIKEKYSSIGYFIPLLENAEHLSENISHDLAEVFRSNRLDELGYFAGNINHEYKHETWRLRSLEMFDIYKKDLIGFQVETSKKHEEIMVELSKSSNVFEVVGALLFLELFVVFEMKSLIFAFERDLPELFPQNGYSYDRFPFNPQEYWYGHALHDTWHFRAIEESILDYFKNQGETNENINSIFAGFKKVVDAKNYLYSTELIEKMIVQK